MQSTAPMLRLAAQAVLLAFAGLLLVALGCSGAQATSAQANTAHVSTAVDASVSHVAAALDKVTAQVSTACVPGRDKVRLECDALPPTPAHLQHSPKNSNDGLPDGPRRSTSAAQLLGRIPASLTHLDLGIVRT